MISRIRGMIREFGLQQIVLEVQGISYEVFLPPYVLQTLAEREDPHGEVELVTYHYQQIDVSRGIPVLIGFLNDIEREFFERFITVAGIGPKAALRAITRPIPTIAQAIDEGDLGVLRSLPGIGEQRAREIVAKLQGKVGKFGLLPRREGTAPQPSEVQRTLEEEALAILQRLEYKKSEAKEMVRAALERNPKLKNAEELLNEVYRQQRLEPAAR